MADKDKPLTVANLPPLMACYKAYGKCRRGATNGIDDWPEGYEPTATAWDDRLRWVDAVKGWCDDDFAKCTKAAIK